MNMSGILGQRADKDVSTSLTVTVLLFPLGLPCKYSLTLESICQPTDGQQMDTVRDKSFGF